MVTELAEISLPDVFGSDALDLDTLIEVRKRVRGISKYRNEAGRILEEWSAYRRKSTDTTSLAIREGFLRFLLGERDSAISILDEVRQTEIGALILSWCHREKGDLPQAEEALELALGRHRSSAAILFGLAEAKLDLRKLDEAEEILFSTEERFGESLDHRYLRAYQREIAGEYDEAMATYWKLLEESPSDPRILFRLAYNEDLRGDSEKAGELYEKCCDQVPIYGNALVNLGLFYEDLGEYVKAAECYESVLKGDPTHDRARMYLGDARASLTMYYDEDKQKRADKRNQILKTPITDFELSVRSRNCLNKMNIRTLGDLIYKTEAELLSYKNFGETSLSEIKDMLSQKGLNLGMQREEMDEGLEQPMEEEPLITDEDEILGRPVETMEFSGRSRKAIEALGVLTIGDLIQKTEAELLSVKNFGYTSLNEVKRKLDEMGLSLRE